MPSLIRRYTNLMAPKGNGSAGARKLMANQIRAHRAAQRAKPVGKGLNTRATLISAITNKVKAARKEVKFERDLNTFKKTLPRHPRTTVATAARKTGGLAHTITAKPRSNRKAIHSTRVIAKPRSRGQATHSTRINAMAPRSKSSLHTFSYQT